MYDQYNNAASPASNSQNFETAYDAYDDFLADDFVVPAGQLWMIDLAEVKGQYYSGPGPATSMNVFFYSNAITLPGTLLAARTNLSYTANLSSTDFVIPLSPTVVLGPGAYWMSVQATQNFSPTGQWGWTDRTVTTTHPAAWQNPGGGFGVCPTQRRNV